jgi:hypothetical protein
MLTPFTHLKHLLIVSLIMLCLSGCYKLSPEARLGTPFRFSHQPQVEAEVIGDLRWGLALSGGGIRSALFSMGAMKALYDASIMDSVQVISSVSGGGYAAYWLYSREHRDPSSEGRLANTFRDDAFRVGMCEVATTGNFYSYWEMLKTIFASETLVEGYDYALLRTFGQAAQDRDSLRSRGRIVETDTIRLHALLPAITAEKVPYLVVNATVMYPHPDSGWAAGLYELTPLLRGNERFGYASWSDVPLRGATSLLLRQAVAISGAAYRRGLKQQIPDARSLSPQSFITLTDGGYSENLGAVALVRRRVKNIIVVDAAHDPQYEFEDYYNLRERLESWGYALSVPGIHRARRGVRLDSAVYQGIVKSLAPGDTFSANIFYIKMSLPVSTDSILSDTSAARRGARADSLIWQALEQGTKLPVTGNWDCDHLARRDENLRDWFVYGVRRYSRFYPETRSRTLTNAFTFEFPHYSTVDQSFYLNQSLAYIGLGYFEGSELVAKLGIR